VVAYTLRVMAEWRNAVELHVTRRALYYHGGSAAVATSKKAVLQV